MKLLDRMPIYQLNRRDNDKRDHFYAKLRLNVGGATLARGVSSLTKELDEELEEYLSLGRTAVLGFAYQIQVLISLCAKCWNDAKENFENAIFN